jgi:murein DD-endopeptidase MepM/ murein hydrolase activator NlpD
MKIVLGSSTGMIVIGMIILIPCLMVMDFFGANITDGYIENNSEYSEKYKTVLNKNIKSGNGYVSLSRILYFYLANDQLSFNEIYQDNLDSETKKQKSITDVCTLDKYKNLSVCSTTEISNSNQVDEEMLKPFSPPLDITNMNVTSFFMEERVVYGKQDIHPAWDFSSTNNTPVYSVCDGKVIDVNFKYSSNTIDKNGGGGNQIKIQCDIDEDTSYTVWYAHLYPNSSKINVGDSVKEWQQIAEVGTTGYSTGPHLHFQVLKEKTNIDGMSLIDFTNTNGKKPIIELPDYFEKDDPFNSNYK